jgi:hypothetical protein
MAQSYQRLPQTPPATVSTAVWGLFGLTGLFVVDRLLTFGLGDATFRWWELITSVLLVALFVALTFSIRQGNNIVRVITTLLLVVGVFRALDPISQSHPFAIRAIGLVELVLEVAIVALLWIGPANRYFIRPHDAR